VGRNGVIGLVAWVLVACGASAFAQDTLVDGASDARGALAQGVDRGLLPGAARFDRDRPVPPAMPVPQTTSSSSWIGRHPVLFGTAVGAGTGLILSQTDAVGGLNHDPRVALAGAGIGAWTGLVVSSVQKARAGKKVSTGSKVGIVAGAIAIVVLPVLACYGAGGCGGTS